MPAGESDVATLYPPAVDQENYHGQVMEAIRGLAKSNGGPRIPWPACHPVPILGSVPITAGAGSLYQADMYGPKDSYWWDVRNLAIGGFTAGTVSVFRNSASGVPLATLAAAGLVNWSAQLLLAPRDVLVFTATGITGSVEFEGQAIEIETLWLPEYLM